VLDPAQPPDPSDAPCGDPRASEAAFSFTAPISATAFIEVYENAPVSVPLTIAIAAGSSCTTYLDCEAFTVADFAELSLSVTAGTTYTIVVGSSANQLLPLQLGVVLEQ
jgi:hypothetical protein